MRIQGETPEEKLNLTPTKFSYLFRAQMDFKILWLKKKVQ